ncbi:hypothetical protein GCM10011494_32920 [Novosphingobium endophyticum]|uniref:RES domain-containing protein n=1 Tax=Novosphingobium endophyticum TaxID=1955250 RepID=A0A916TVK3_9SPHN|nr:RES family NAD+ phosphorylase [Novosphingobium endophyticum]GGC11546.1 hypothetical protein GCM10011494_32920 [Novosphingobium endophyticum]
MWTSTELESELITYVGRVWRVVEAQHRISTNRLATNLDDQFLLEQLAEEVKPQVPESARGLDFLLASPFRYGHRQESRFRRAGERPGIFYASERESTAIAETAYWRLRFFSRSPGFRPPSTTSEYTSFSVQLRSDCALDLTRPPFALSADCWNDPDDYTACQEMAGAAREAGTQLIRSLSVRDPAHGCNVVVLDPGAFAERAPRRGKTWHLRFEAGQLTALAAFPSDERFVFAASSFGLGG